MADSGADSLAGSLAESGGDREGASRAERRRYRRFRLELSVNVHLGGRPEPVTVEIVDIAVRGVRFRSPAGALLSLASGTQASDSNRDSSYSAGRVGTSAVSRVRLLDEASFGFVSQEQHICVAHGRVLRVAADAAAASSPGESPDQPASGDEFVVSVERANAAFHSFLASLAA